VTAGRIIGCSHEFVGRQREIESIISAANIGRSTALLAAPGCGASEVLKQTYDKLFGSQGITPFYFELKRSDRDAERAALRFANEFLVQSVAYIRQDPVVLRTHPTVDELSRAAPPEEGYWIDAAAEAVGNASVETLMGFPARARGRVCILIDGLDRVRLIRDGARFLEGIKRLSCPSVTVIAVGRRRAMYGRVPFQHVDLAPLSTEDAAAVARAVAEKNGATISDAASDLVAVQTEGSAVAISLLITQAASNNEDLSQFAGVERTYTDSLFGGFVARYFRKRILEPLPTALDQNDVVRLLAQNLSAPGMRLRIGHWRRSLKEVDDAAFGRLIRHLHVEEVISAGDGTVNMSATPRVVRDYVDARSRILEAPEKRGSTVGRAMQSNFARASRLMTEAYRTRAALGVRDFLASLNGQSIPAALVNYDVFKRDLKGQDDAKILLALGSAKQRIELPRILYTADAVTYYAPIGELSDKDRSAVGITESGESWLIAEIDSKLEADNEAAEFWCDRLEMTALNSGLDDPHIWLVAPEGFTEEALETLAERHAYGSSRKQIELLRGLLKTPAAPAPEDGTQTTYEVNVPMGEEGELIAARTLSEVATKHAIPRKAAAQAKTALIEALINSAEHSLSPDRTVQLLFVISDTRLTISLQNRGLKLTEHMLAQADLSSERRGWGLELMRRLMDEVNVAPTDDGTRLVMSKQFDRAKG